MFNYVVTDVNGGTATGTLTIIVQGTNDAPVITSDAAAAQGAVTEAGTADPVGTPSATGVLTAEDVDTGAMLAWSIADTEGTYGTIAIDAATGAWIYTLDNAREATQALNDGDERTETFTVRVTDEHGAFSEQIVTVSVNGANDDLQGTGAATVPLSEDPTQGPDGNARVGTLQAYVSDVDDTIELVSFTIAGDGTTYDPGDTATIPGVGTLSIALYGGYVFTPLPNYSGEVPQISYTMAEVAGGQSVTQTLDFVITPVADAPVMETARTVTTDEDASVGLELVLPTVADNTDHNGPGSNGDDPERLGAITLRPDGADAADATFSTTVAGIPTTLVPVGGVITIVITDVAGSTEPSALHVADTDLVPARNEAGGVYYLTAAEYQAITAEPGEHDHRNFTVTVEATSYEVDADGAKLAEVDGATATQVITVDVHAVTDAPGLTLEAPADPATVGAVSLSTTPAAGGSNALIDAAINEDTTLTLTDVLRESFQDTDGSERYWFEISGLPPGTIVRINGTDYTANASGTATMPEDPGLSASAAANASFTITPPLHYSNDAPIEATITLNVKDDDSDSPSATPAVESVSVDMHLRVYAVADDVDLPTPAASPEDTPVAFLAGLALVDDDGSESITQVRITGLPNTGGDWTLFDHDGNAVVIPPGGDEDGGGLVLAIGAGPGEYTLEQVRAFSLLPPAHSSLDGSITVYVSTTEAAANTASGDPLTEEWPHTLPIVVRPAAESVGTDSNDDGDDDVTMNGDHSYGGFAGKEDEWYALGTNRSDATGGDDFPLGADWGNEDPGEFTYAVLTPTLDSTNPGDSVIGTMFRYHDGSDWTELTYTGEAVWVPSEHLDTLQVRAPADVSGTLTIGMQAGTVDYDDDANVTTRPVDPPRESVPGVVSVQVSGSATLSLIELEPVADAVTLALNGRASGQEDKPITLAIRASSSDSSETFNIIIEGIPDGSILIHDGDPVAVTGGVATIENFDHTRLTTITPPEHSNENFTLRVSAQSVDGSDISDATPVRNIQVSVQGVADDAVVEPAATAPIYTEAALDGGAAVTLADLIASVVSPDTDGSETLSLRITGLAEDFSITGATLVSVGNGGDTRVWTAPADALGSVRVRTPDNYSGNVNFQVAGVTTEIDGDSHTGVPTTVGFAVTPSPEAITTSGATLVEDQITPIGLEIIHQNGDTDETLGDVFIAVDDSATSLFTLYLGNTELTDTGLDIEAIGGIDHYVIPAGQVGELGARGAEQLDGDLGGFRFQYEVTDTGYGEQAAESPVTVIRDGSIFSLTATPVTDAVDVSITGITGADSTANDDPDDNADPDAATVTVAGSTVTVNLHVDSVDHDGSEHLIRVVIEDVPQGVTVVDGAPTGANTWVLVLDGANALSIDQADGIDLPVEFIIGPDVGTDRTETPITMTVHTQDRGNQAAPGTDVAKDSVTWTLVTDLAPGPGFAAPTIDVWAYNDTHAFEDTTFRLADMLDAQVSIHAPGVPNTFTVSLTEVPAGTAITGMFLTDVAGVPTWTATVTVPAGDDAQAALEALLEGIGITPPADSNDNNNGGDPFTFQASLSTSAAGGRNELETIEMPIPVTPVTDEALIIVSAADVDEGPDADIAVSITVSNPRDGASGAIVENTLYVRVDASGDNAGGTLSLQGGAALTSVPITDISGIPDGDYYLFNFGSTGGTVDLVYTPAEGASLQPGTVDFHAYARTLETGAANTVTGTAADTATVAIAHNGVTVTDAGWTGHEAAGADPANAIHLSGLSVALNDADGSESIDAIMLAGVPVGFLAYVGPDAANVTLAGNAGGDGISNTWVLAAGGDLPAHVAVLPPAHWSGMLGDMQLVVESGETGLPSSLTETFDLPALVVEPVADGLTIEPSIAFGREDSIIDLNLNAAMLDPLAATATVDDASVETTTLQFTGLGAYAAFYIEGALLAPGDGAPGYDMDTDTYTLAGLSQGDLDKLGFMQAASALSDQDPAEGMQARVTAWTVEGDGSESAKVSDTLDLQITAVPGTSGDDTLIWGGAGHPVINGRAGDDTVMLRIGESATGAGLSGSTDPGTGLRNIETIDLSVAGANSVTSLTLQDVFDMTDGNKELAFLGDDQDSVSLGGAPGDWTQGASIGGRTEYSGAIDGATIRVHIADAINVSIL